MKVEEESDAHFLLRKLLSAGTPLSASAHPWISEDDRWGELAFSLLANLSRTVPEYEVRHVVNRLTSLGLLNIKDLAGANSEQGEKTPATKAGNRRIASLLREHGFSEAEATRGLSLLRAVASGLQSHFKGKVQLFLRHYGELMLHDSEHMFDIQSTDRATFGVAVIYWLQNALNMPLSLVDHTMWNFCEENGITPESLLAAADDLNINVAFLDDLIHETATTGKTPERQTHSD